MVQMMVPWGSNDNNENAYWHQKSFLKCLFFKLDLIFVDTDTKQK